MVNVWVVRTANRGNARKGKVATGMAKQPSVLTVVVCRIRRVAS